MNKAWLVREPCTVWFDVKPIHEALGTEKLDSSVEIKLSDDDYSGYIAAVEAYNAWQLYFDTRVK